MQEMKHGSNSPKKYPGFFRSHFEMISINFLLKKDRIRNCLDAEREKKVIFSHKQ